MTEPSHPTVSDFDRRLREAELDLKREDLELRKREMEFREMELEAQQANSGRKGEGVSRAVSVLTVTVPLLAAIATAGFGFWQATSAQIYSAQLANRQAYLTRRDKAYTDLLTIAGTATYDLTSADIQQAAADAATDPKTKQTALAAETKDYNSFINDGARFQLAYGTEFRPVCLPGTPDDRAVQMYSKYLYLLTDKTPKSTYAASIQVLWNMDPHPGSPPLVIDTANQLPTVETLEQNMDTVLTTSILDESDPAGYPRIIL